MVSPSSLTFTATGSGNAQTFVASTQFAGDIAAVSSDVTVATVNPASAPAVKDPNDSRKSVTFTVTPIAPGTCTITVTDKKGNTAVVTVIVSQPHNSWTTKAPMPTARYQMGVGVVNNILYAVGGDTNNRATEGGYVEAYDPSTNAWTTKAPMPTSRTGLAVGVVNGIIYAIGGQDNLVGGGATLNTVEAYNPLTNTWTTKAPMPTARVSLAVGVVNGIIYAVGGLDASSNYVNTVEAYDPSTDTWTTKAPMPTARAYLAASGVNAVVYAVGGFNGTFLNTNEGYNPSTNMWATETPMLTARRFLAADVVNNVLYAVGGADTGGYSNANEAYDPIANAWTTKAPMPTARQFLSAGVVNGTLYAVGGFNVNVLNTNEAYTP